MRFGTRVQDYLDSTFRPVLGRYMDTKSFRSGTKSFRSGKSFCEIFSFSKFFYTVNICVSCFILKKAMIFKPF